jgi:hypothetical protein
MRDLIEFFGGIVLFVLGLALAAFLVFGAPLLLWGDRKVPELRLEAPAWLQKAGFDVIAHEGFTYGLFSQPGGCAWYLLHKTGDPKKVVYQACVAKWHDGKLELWQLTAVDAIRGN